MSIDAKLFRQSLGSFATGVCIVCVEADGKWIGMIINSFASVSLDPALILWSIQNDSQCFAAFTQAKKFTVSVLSKTQQDLSNHYAAKDNHGMRAADFDADRGVIKNAITTFECDAWQTYAGGDHEIIVGKVTAVENLGGEPLIFQGGQYAALA